MSSPEQRTSEARAYYQAGRQKAMEAPNPEGQKFPKGTRVHIKKDLGPSKSHFRSDCYATVVCTYFQAYGGYDDIDKRTYCLDIDGTGEVSWYDESEITAI